MMLGTVYRSRQLLLNTHTQEGHEKTRRALLPLPPSPQPPCRHPDVSSGSPRLPSPTSNVLPGARLLQGVRVVGRKESIRRYHWPSVKVHAAHAVNRK